MAEPGAGSVTWQAFARHICGLRLIKRLPLPDQGGRLQDMRLSNAGILARWQSTNPEGL